MIWEAGHITKGQSRVFTVNTQWGRSSQAAAEFVGSRWHNFAAIDVVVRSWPRKLETKTPLQAFPCTCENRIHWLISPKDKTSLCNGFYACTMTTFGAWCANFRIAWTMTSSDPYKHTRCLFEWLPITVNVVLLSQLQCEKAPSVHRLAWLLGEAELKFVYGPQNQPKCCTNRLGEFINCPSLFFFLVAAHS